MPSFQSFQECPHKKLFFNLKDKNYKKAKMKGGLGWMKYIGNDPRSLFNGNHFLVGERSEPLSRVFNDKPRDIIGERSEPLSMVFNDQPRDIYIYIYMANVRPYVRF